MNKKPIIILVILLGIIVIFGLVLVYSAQAANYYNTNDYSSNYQNTRYSNDGYQMQDTTSQKSNKTIVIIRTVEKDIYETACGERCFRYPEVKQTRLEPCPGRKYICERDESDWSSIKIKKC